MNNRSPEYEIVLLRHGESTWNAENRFTGWTDVPLTQRGVQEAVDAGKLLRQENFAFDLAYTSRLNRCLVSTFHVLQCMDRLWIPVEKSWLLNERHYGALQGLNKEETARKYGEEQVLRWRRSYDAEPPLLDILDDRHPRHDPRYTDVPPELLPRGESLKDTVGRVRQVWEHSVCPQLRQRRSILILAHGNSIRALVKIIGKISEETIQNVNIPTGVPLVYKLDADLNAISSRFLERPDEPGQPIMSLPASQATEMQSPGRPLGRTHERGADEE
jgi:2,3-bisphosphoglycerate-dependent phosphoglycerate mutase